MWSLCLATCPESEAFEIHPRCSMCQEFFFLPNNISLTGYTHHIYPFHLHTLHGPSTLPLCRYFKISLLSIHSRGANYQMTSEILTSQDSVPRCPRGRSRFLNHSFIQQTLLEPSQHTKPPALLEFLL